MTGNDLLEKMSLMDVCYVEKANEETKKTVKGWHKWRKEMMAAAACLAVAVLVGIIIYGGLSVQERDVGNSGDNNYTSVATMDDDTETAITSNRGESTESDTESETEANHEDAIDASSGADGSYDETVAEEVLSWEEMGIYQKYSVVSVSGVDYTAKSAEISADWIADELATVTANASYEESELSEEDRICEVQIYAIKNIAEECAVAVQYQNSTVYYAAVNPAYQPASLSQLLEDLNLKATLEIGAVWYYEEGEDLSETTTIELDESKIWELLSLEADRLEVQDSEGAESGVRISAKIPLIGYEVSAGSGYGYVMIEVCGDGYLMISIPDTGDWVFAIGENAAGEFVAYARSLAN